MSVTLTTNYEFKKPTDGNDDDDWGEHLNESLDLIDSTIKDVSDVADQAAADAAAALAAVGGTALMDVEENAATAGNDTYDVELNALKPVTTLTKTGGVIDITLNNSPGGLAAGKAEEFNFVIHLSGGSSARFFAGTDVTLIPDLGVAGVTLNSQGRHFLKIFCYRLAAGNCIILVKKIGTTTT